MSLNSAHKPHQKRASYAGKKDFDGGRKNFGRASAQTTISNTGTSKPQNIHAKWGYNPNETFYSVSKDLPTVDDIEAAVAKVVSILGPVGQMLEPGKNTKANVIISTPKMGKIWYGDINYVADADAVLELEKIFGRSLFFSL